MQNAQDELIRSLFDRKYQLKRSISELQSQGEDAQNLSLELEQVESQLANFDSFDLVPENFEDL